MPAQNKPRYLDPVLWLELFVIVNIAFLSADIWLAHSVNQFAHDAEYIPLFFSVIAPVVLLMGLVLGEALGFREAWRDLGYLVGWLAVAIGLLGVVFHLDSRFFEERTIRSLVYAAPFAAPLAYTGLGLLLIANRMIDFESAEWPYWVLLMALGGFLGNFVFSLTDHAQNGFFHPTEWIPVISSAIAVGFLATPFLTKVGRPYLRLCGVAMLVQAAVGLLGAFYHLQANLNGPSPNLLANIIDGAPIFAPLLFPNLVLLAAIPLWVLDRRFKEDAEARMVTAPEPALQA